MKRDIIPTKVFEKLIHDFIRKKKILIKDYEDLKRLLASYPEKGPIYSRCGWRKKN